MRYAAADLSQGRGGSRPAPWALVAIWTALFCGPAVAAGEPDLPDDPAAEQRLLAAAGPTFQLHRTRHFLIAYDTDAETLRDFVARVEATYQGALRFLDVHDIEHQRLAHRLEIIFFSTPEAFRGFAKGMKLNVTGAAGFYHPASNRAFFYDAGHAPRVLEMTQQIERIEGQASRRGGASRAADAEIFEQARRLRLARDRLIETINLLVVQHEVAHQVFFNTGLHVRGAETPPWVAEGLATLFEMPPSADGAGLGAVNQYRLMSFREALAGEGGWKDAKAEQFEAACANGNLVPLRQLIGDKSLFNTADTHVEQRYAQAWSFVSYLHTHKGEDLAVYLTVLARRPADRGYTPEQEVMLFEKTFGAIDAKFERRWLDFVLRQHVRPPR